MIYVDLWGWFESFRWEAQHSGDRDRQEMIRVYYQAWRSGETGPEQALGLMTQGYKLAEMLNERCWMLFFDYWRCEMFMFYLEDLNAGLDAAVRMTVEARKPQYQGCPVLACAYRVLLDAHVLIDPVGYEDKIRETLDYMEHQIALDHDTHCILEARKANLEFALDDFEAAKAATLHYLELSETSDFQKSSAFLMLCGYSYWQGDLNSTLGYATNAETFARRVGRKKRIATALAWQALVARKHGDEEAAQRLCRQALAQAETLGVSPSYYEPLCDYHEIGGEPDKALKMRDRQLEDLIGTGYIHDECEIRLKRCRLLGRMGLPVEAEIAGARASATRLLKPARY